jgi:ergothioneine biosynthesis protein EgtB
VDEAMARLLDGDVEDRVVELVELGLHHEQQHQELLLMDIKHVLAANPLRPAYASDPGAPAPETGSAGGGWRDSGWLDHAGGPVEIGHVGPGFAFDNESPRHVVYLTPFALADRPVTCGDWLEFMADDGYRRAELWLSDGWALAGQERWRAPLYWFAEDGGDWQVFTITGPRPVDRAEPVCHVSYYEADAFAHWTGTRLPTESEWEAIAADQPVVGNFSCGSVLHPPATGPGYRLFGDVWEWTSSAYSPYPGFRAPAGAVGEYNGKFMVNQYVLRGGCCATPAGHVRPTYRNFFPASARWAFSGVRLARDC